MLNMISLFSSLSLKPDVSRSRSAVFLSDCGELFIAMGSPMPALLCSVSCVPMSQCYTLAFLCTASFC